MEDVISMRYLRATEMFSKRIEENGKVNKEVNQRRVGHLSTVVHSAVLNARAFIVPGKRAYVRESVSRMTIDGHLCHVIW